MSVPGNRRARALPFLFAWTLAACAGAGTDPASGSSSPAGALSAARDERMAWWREARFGLFVHWGLYAVPAGEWGVAPLRRFANV